MFTVVYNDSFIKRWVHKSLHFAHVLQTCDDFDICVSPCVLTCLAENWKKKQFCEKWKYSKIFVPVLLQRWSCLTQWHQREKLRKKHTIFNEHPVYLKIYSDPLPALFMSFAVASCAGLFASCRSLVLSWMYGRSHALCWKLSTLRTFTHLTPYFIACCNCL